MNKVKSSKQSINSISKKSNAVNRFVLFTTGFVQVFFVAVNTYFLLKESYEGVFVSSFIISLIWSFNVSKIAFGSTIDRIIYASGTTLGSLLGLYSSSFILTVIK